MGPAACLRQALLVGPANAINGSLYGNFSFNFLSDIAPVAESGKWAKVIEASGAKP
jgi:hypothetical protein